MAVYNIPAGLPFAKTLAQKLLHDFTSNPEGLADILILLPTRRACRTLRESFLRENNGKPIILPRMQALGDIDEEELSLSIAGSGGTQSLLNLPPSLPSTRRQILLARAIHQQEEFSHTFDHALSLAKTLGQLMDQIYTENLDMKDLANLVPEDFAHHWQITLDFLKILSEEWPQILETLGVIDAADRRNKLILALSCFWQKNPPKHRIIAAGTTGSLPATAELLNTISNIPHGEIILPGFDDLMDDESWENLSESHPQYGFKALLDHLELPRASIQNWKEHQDKTSSVSANRRSLAYEMMRPAQTTKNWQNLQTDAAKANTLKNALDNLSIIECETQQEEATAIAFLMRSILEHPAKTATLITPDRNLAKCVAAACHRWGITLDDSAGKPLSQTSIGQFFTLSAQMCESALSPITLLSVLKNKLCKLNIPLIEFEETLLRGPKPPAGIKGLHIRKQEIEENKKKDLGHLNEHIDTLEIAINPLLNLFETNEPEEIEKFFYAHITIVENLSSQDPMLWSGEEAEKMATFLSGLLQHKDAFPKIRPQDYTTILQQFLNAETIRPRFGTHPRLQILGQLEARLIDSDLVILGGLNEGTWPPDPGHDPWMSRPMRKQFGLPSAERSIGLSAHDFVQGFCMPNVLITHTKRKDGTPQTPARWLQRLDTVLEAANIETDNLYDHPVKHWIEKTDLTDNITPIQRPAPKPELEKRPRHIRITDVETWLKDPYSIYAHYILNLKKLDPLEQQEDAALRGQILHDTLETFVDDNKDTIPQNAQDILQKLAAEYLEKHHIDPDSWSFYWPRFETIMDGFLQKESDWRTKAKPYKSEIKGKMSLNTNAGDFVLYGRADRIDTIKGISNAEGAAIIDYKSGGQFPKSGIENGDLPQLPLEALILEHGGFENIPKTRCAYIGYWVLNVNGKNTEIDELSDIIETTQTSLQTLIETYDDPETPYHCIPRAGKAPRYNDYEHLARIKEWAALDEQEDAA